MTRIYKRPSIPYTEGKKRPNNNRYKILTDAKKPLTPDHLDGEMNYVIDSLNQVSKDANKAASGLVIGSDKINNKDKLLTTDGQKEPTLSWIKISSEQLEENAVQSGHILDQEVTRSKIANNAIDTSKIEEESVTVERMKFLYGTEEKAYQHRRAWARGIGEAENSKDTIVVRDKEGGIKVDKIDAGAISSSTITEMQAAIKEMQEKSVESVRKAIDDVFDTEHPVGSYNFSNPRDGQEINGHKVEWKLIEGGKVLVTSDNTEAKEINTEQNIRDKTAGHALSVKEMPSHNHEASEDRKLQVHWYTGQGAWATGLTGGKKVPKQKTSFSGGNQSHNHKLDLTRIELPLYKRIS